LSLGSSESGDGPVLALAEVGTHSAWWVPREGPEPGKANSEMGAESEPAWQGEDGMVGVGSSADPEAGTKIGHRTGPGRGGRTWCLGSSKQRA
jgi:hypothetical protein